MYTRALVLNLCVSVCVCMRGFYVCDFFVCVCVSIYALLCFVYVCAIEIYFSTCTLRPASSAIMKKIIGEEYSESFDLQGRLVDFRGLVVRALRPLHVETINNATSTV